MGLFTRMYQAAQEPLLKELLRFVRQDEARHFAFGVLSLRDYYAEALSEADRREREDFAFEVCAIMRGRTYPKEAWEAMGLPVDTCLRVTRAAARRSHAQLSSFTRVTAALKTIGLLSERMRPHYAQIGLRNTKTRPSRKSRWCLPRRTAPTGPLDMSGQYGRQGLCTSLLPDTARSRHHAPEGGYEDTPHTLRGSYTARPRTQLPFFRAEGWGTDPPSPALSTQQQLLTTQEVQTDGTWLTHADCQLAGASRYRTPIFQSGMLAVIEPLSEYDFLKGALVVHANKEAVVSGDVRLTYKQFGERASAGKIDALVGG